MLCSLETYSQYTFLLRPSCPANGYVPRFTPGCPALMFPVFSNVVLRVLLLASMLVLSGIGCGPSFSAQALSRSTFFCVLLYWSSFLLFYWVCLCLRLHLAINFLTFFWDNRTGKYQLFVFCLLSTFHIHNLQFPLSSLEHFCSSLRLSWNVYV